MEDIVVPALALFRRSGALKSVVPRKRESQNTGTCAQKIPAYAGMTNVAKAGAMPKLTIKFNPLYTLRLVTH